jgi:hypothetical protein
VPRAISGESVTTLSGLVYIWWVMRCVASALLLLTLALLALAQPKPKPLTIGQTKPPDANPQYFPIGVFGTKPGFSDWVARWFASQLRALKEPSLYKDETSTSSQFGKNVNDVDAYRITILPTWGNAVAISVQKNGELYNLSARRLDGQAGFEIGQLVESKDVSLGADDSKTLAELIQNLHFLQMSTNDDVRGFDGDEWIMEGVSQGKYHVAVRWCASSCDPKKRNLTAFLALCKFLVTKSTLSDRPKNKGHKLI